MLAREVAGEAEILTVAVADKFARTGLGWRLMQSAVREAMMRGAETMFLEVDSNNASALGLYKSSASKRSLSARPITQPRMARSRRRLSCAAIFASSLRQAFFGDSPEIQPEYSKGQKT